MKHNLAITAKGEVVAWGRNHQGQFDVPAHLRSGTAVAAGAAHSMVLRGDGTVVCWGLKADGQCDVPAECSQVIATAAGAYHSLALMTDGSVSCWGAAGVCESIPAECLAGWVGSGDYHAQASVADCNQSGVPDCIEVTFERQSDCNGDHVPDECEMVSVLA